MSRLFRSLPMGPAAVVGLFLSCAAMTGCRANMAPVLNLANVPAVPPMGGTFNPENVRASILRAMASKGWVLEQERPGDILAAVTRDGQGARVTISYTDRSFSITYHDSSPGLKYDGRIIHKRYNFWIDRLRAAIQQELRRAPPPMAGQPV